MTGLRATYRLQLAGDFGFAAARELVPYLADLGVSHLYLPPSFQARPGSTHGYDVVDPGRFSDALGGEEEFRALVDAARGAGLGIVLDIVPNHMATDDANRWWADEELRREVLRRRPRDRAATAASSTSTTSPPCGRRTRRCSRPRTGSRCGWCARASWTGCGWTIPDGLADPAGYLRAAARRRSASTSGSRRSSIPGEPLRDWAVEGTVGYEFLNDVAALFVDPAGEGPLTGLWEEIAGDARPFGEVAAGGEARAGDAACSRRRSSGWRGSSARDDLPEALSSLPVYRTYIRDGRAAPRGRRGGPRGRRRVAAGRAAGVRHPLPADDAGDHGQGRGGHGLLPPRAAAGAQRRGRRPVALRDRRRRLPRGQRRARRALPAQPADHDDPRRQALGRRARADRRAGGHGRGVGGARPALVRRSTSRCARGRARTAWRSTSSTRRSWAPGRSRPSASRRTWRRRCARPSATRTGSSPTRRGRARSSASRALSTSTSRSWRTSSRSRSGWPRPASARRWASWSSS